MRIHDFTGEPQQLTQPGQAPKMVKQKLETFKIAGDKDMIEFCEEMAKGRDIVLQVEGKDCSYMMIREFLPVKIQTPNLEIGS